MKTFNLKKLFILFFSFVSFLLLLTPLANASGPTYVKGIISTDTAWTLANSPYILTAPTLVESGATLTVEPGVEVRFAEGSKLTVEGRLQAVGTSSNKIKFTADLKTSSQGISVSSGTLQYVEIDKISAGFSNAQISNSDFSESSGFGFGNSTISNSNFTRNKALSFTNSTVSYSRLYNNAGGETQCNIR